MNSDLVGVTIGVGAEHARLAEETAGRMRRFTGVEVRILGDRDLGRSGCRDPNHLKFRLFDLVDAGSVLYFDADAFCLRPWDPRPLAGRPDWVAVRGFWFDERVRRLGEVYGFGDDIIQGGLFLCSREYHARVLRLAEALQPPDDTFHGLMNPDEVALSTALKVLGVRVLFLDRRYDWLQYGRGDLADDAGVVVAHACDPTLRGLYLGRGVGGGPGHGAEGCAIPAEVAGMTFLYDRVGHDLRPLHFREDGTVGEGGGDAERYYFAPAGGGGELVLGSAWDETCRLTRGSD